MKLIEYTYYSSLSLLLTTTKTFNLQGVLKACNYGKIIGVIMMKPINVFVIKMMLLGCLESKGSNVISLASMESMALSDEILGVHYKILMCAVCKA